jgi:hypothetical protein
VYRLRPAFRHNGELVSPLRLAFGKKRITYSPLAGEVRWTRDAGRECILRLIDHHEDTMVTQRQSHHFTKLMRENNMMGSGAED